MKIKYNILGSIVLMILLSTSVFAQNGELFKYFNESEIKLSEHQQKLFKSIKARPQSQEVHLIKFIHLNFDTDREYFHINLPEKTIKAKKSNNVREVRANTWKGELGDTPISSVQF